MTKPKIGPPRNYVGYFSLVQEVSLQMSARARKISGYSMMAPAFNKLIVEELQAEILMAERAIKAIKEAQGDWERFSG